MNIRFLLFLCFFFSSAFFQDRRKYYIRNGSRRDIFCFFCFFEVSLLCCSFNWGEHLAEKRIYSIVSFKFLLYACSFFFDWKDKNICRLIGIKVFKKIKFFLCFLFCPLSFHRCLFLFTCMGNESQLIFFIDLLKLICIKTLWVYISFLFVSVLLLISFSWTLLKQNQIIWSRSKHKVE